MNIQDKFQDCFFYTFPAESPLDTLSTGITWPIGPYDYTRRLSDCWSFEYIYEGSGTLIRGDSVFPLQAGDMFLLHPGMPHRFYAHSSWKKMWVSVVAPNPYMEHLIGDFRLNHLDILPGIHSPLYLEEIFGLVKSGETGIHRRLELLLHRQAASMAEFSQDLVLPVSPSLTERARRYLDSHLEAHVSLSDLCAYLGVGKKALTSLFSEAYHITPMAYYRRIRLIAAQDKLAHTDMTVSEIAALYGFSDAYYFSTLFKNHTGMTPSAYRQNR